MKKGGAHLWDAYENVLFKKGKPMPFENADGKRFVGSIQGVSRGGRLKIAVENVDVKLFALKEVRMLY